MNLPARTSWPPPFETLPDNDRAMRLRAIRDGLIITGWLCTGFMFLVVLPIAHSFGYDAFSYWSINFADLYGRAMSTNFGLGAFRYAPPSAFLFAPLGLLPWWLFLWLWEALLLALITWLSGRWTIVVLALPFVALELYHGNIHILIAAAVVLGLRYPVAWSFVLLTKVTPGVGVLWFAARKEWRNLAIALGSTALIAGITFVLAPNYWSEWISSIFSNLNEPQQFSIPPAAPIRLPIAALIVLWGARTDRPWTVAVAATLGLPIIWPTGLCVLLGAIPFLRRGDQAARLPDWRNVVQLRPLAVSLGVFIGGALVLALVFGDAIHQAMNWSSTNLFQSLGLPQT